MPPSARGRHDDAADSLSEPLLADDLVETPVSTRIATRGTNGSTPPNTTVRRQAGLGIPPSPTPAEWVALRRDMRVREGELYFTPASGARPTSVKGVPLLRDTHMFRSINHFDVDANTRAGSFSPVGNHPNEPHETTETETERVFTQRLALATEYVRDALDGSTHLTFRKESRFAKNIAKAQRSFAYVALFRLLLFAHLGLVFWEPRNRMDFVSADFSHKQIVTLLCVELGIASTFLAAVGLDIARLGYERWRKKHWRFVFSACSLAIFMDVAVALTMLSTGTDRELYYARPTRSLRPLLVIAHHHAMRRLVSSALKTLYSLKNVVKLLCVLVLAYATLGVQMYQGAYDVTDVDVRGNFDNAFDASIAMAVLLTTENFPDIMRPALGPVAVHRVPQAASVFFFVSFVIFGVWLGMSLWTSVIFETYKSQHRRKIGHQKTHELKALITAYSVLQDRPAHTALSMRTWVALAVSVKPSLTSNAATALFATIDTNGDETISIDEFLHTVELLRSTVTKVSGSGLRNADGGPGNHAGGNARNPADVVTSGLDTVGDDVERGDEPRSQTSSREIIFRRIKSAAKSTVKSKAFLRSSKLLALAQVCVLCSRRRHAGAGENELIDGMDGFCVLLLCLEVSVTCLAGPINGDSKSDFFWRNGFDIVVAAVSCALLLPRITPQHRRVIGPIRCFRLLSVDQKQREILHTFARCGTVVATLLATLTCVIYGYGAVGLELFGSEVTRNRGFCLTGDETYANRSGVVVTQDVLGSMGATQYMFGSAQNSTNSTGNPSTTPIPCLDAIENFETPWNAFLSLFQVATSNNWHDILYPNASAMKHVDGSVGRCISRFHKFRGLIDSPLGLLLPITTNVRLEYPDCLLHWRVVAVLFFVSFYFTAVLLLVNILTSLVLEMFGSGMGGGGDGSVDETTSDGDETTTEGDLLGVSEEVIEGLLGTSETEGIEPRSAPHATRGAPDAPHTPNRTTNRTLVTLDGESYLVARKGDFTEHLLLEGPEASRERKALLDGLAEVETQIARRLYERVARALAGIREARVVSGVRSGVVTPFPTQLSTSDQSSAGGNRILTTDQPLRAGGFRSAVSAMLSSRSAVDLRAELATLSEEEWGNVSLALGRDFRG